VTARLLLDTHIILWLVQGKADRIPKSMRDGLQQSGASLAASVISLWEIVLKGRLGKLELEGEPSLLVAALEKIPVRVLELKADHILSPEPEGIATRDPFDRMLLQQCAAEGYQLMTVDRALADHPLAWRP